MTLFDLFLAGSETTSTTLNWAVLYMVRYPDIQAKVQEELDTVVGTDRLHQTRMTLHFMIILHQDANCLR